MRSVILVLLVAAGCRRGAPAPSTPADPVALDQQGEAQLAEGRLDDAEASFRAALAAAPDFAPAHDGLAMIRFHRGDWSAGIAELEAGIALAEGAADPGPTIRLLENLAWAHMVEGREDAAFDAVARSVVAQGLESAEATRGVTHLGRARLRVLAAQWELALEEAAAARAGEVPDYVRWVSRAIEASAHAGAGALEPAEQALAALIAEVGAEHPLVGDPRLDLALARGAIDEAAALLPGFDAGDPYAAERARFAVARALLDAGREAEAAPLFEALASRHLRSVGSARIRRMAAELAAR